jgi:hypothetical protein
MCGTHQSFSSDEMTFGAANPSRLFRSLAPPFEDEHENEKNNVGLRTALPVFGILRYTDAVISDPVFHFVNSDPDPLAASCKLVASVSLSRS